MLGSKFFLVVRKPNKRSEPARAKLSHTYFSVLHMPDLVMAGLADFSM